jgi:hypothetical protein
LVADGGVRRAAAGVGFVVLVVEGVVVGCLLRPGRVAACLVILPAEVGVVTLPAEGVTVVASVAAEMEMVALCAEVVEEERVTWIADVKIGRAAVGIGVVVSIVGRVVVRAAVEVGVGRLMAAGFDRVSLFARGGFAGNAGGGGVAWASLVAIVGVDGFAAKVDVVALTVERLVGAAGVVGFAAFFVFSSLLPWACCTRCHWLVCALPPS